MSKWEIVIDGCGGLLFNYQDQAEAYAVHFLSGRNFFLRELAAAPAADGGRA